MPTVLLANKFDLKSDYSLASIRNGDSYKDYSYEYYNLTIEDKQKIVSQLREQLL